MAAAGPALEVGALLPPSSCSACPQPAACSARVALPNQRLPCATVVLNRLYKATH